MNAREMIRNAPSEIIHIPPAYQRFQSVLDLPHAAVAVIRNSPSTIRTLSMSDTNYSTLFLYFIHPLLTYDVSCIVQPIPGHYVIELKAPNSSNTPSNSQYTSVPNSTSTWPV
jgi:hypothetical protein